MGTLIRWFTKALFILLVPPLATLAVAVALGHGFAAVHLVSDKAWAEPVVRHTGWVYRCVPEDPEHWLTSLTHDFGKFLGVPEEMRHAAAEVPEPDVEKR